jgi:hypothetical protein
MTAVDARRFTCISLCAALGILIAACQDTHDVLAVHNATAATLTVFTEDATPQTSDGWRLEPGGTVRYGWNVHSRPQFSGAVRAFNTNGSLVFCRILTATSDRHGSDWNVDLELGRVECD